MKNVRSIVISLGLALLAVLLVYSYVQKQERRLLDMSTPVKVVVAAKNIPEGTRLDESNLVIREIPKAFVQPGTISDMTLLYDQVVAVPMLEGTQLLESVLAPQEKVGLAQKIPKGKVGYTVAVNNVTGIAALLQPGDYVDVLMTVDVGNPSADGKIMVGETLSKVVLENILILAVDQRSRRMAIRSEPRQRGSNTGNIFNPETGDGKEGKKVATATLAVDHQACLRLNMAQEIGHLSLALRSKWNQGEDWKVKALDSYEFLGVEKPVLRKSMPSWVEIRGAEQRSRY